MSNRSEQDTPTLVPHSVMVSQIDAAVAAEREACAKIADDAARTGSGSGFDRGMYVAAVGIAAAIRARGAK